MASSASPAADLSALVRDISVSSSSGDVLRPECQRLARKVSLLSHLSDEINEFFSRSVGEGSSEPKENGLEQLKEALKAAKRFLKLGRVDSRNVDTESVPDKITVQFKYVMWQLEKALQHLPFDYFHISEEIQEQVELVRAQLKREMEKKEAPDTKLLSEIHETIKSHRNGDLPSQIPKIPAQHKQLEEIVLPVTEIHEIPNSDIERIICSLIEKLEKISTENCNEEREEGEKGNSENCRVEKGNGEKVKKENSVTIPEDFRCPISLELIRDPVIVSTGQTYERAFIQRWIDNGNRTCPKTQQKLQNLTLTPNYVLRSLITQWCEDHQISPPTRSLSSSSLDLSNDRLAVESLVKSLSSPSLSQSAAAEIRNLAKRSTDNRILLAEAGAIPALVGLLSSKDLKTQEHAVTALLNLSIYDHNKELIVLAGAITPIVGVLRSGSMEARENAAAAIFSLSLIDENKITVGSTPGAIESLVELLQTGSTRGHKDAATALFNLCIYQANKVRAVRAGILSPLIQMLQDLSSNGTIDEALTILSVLVSHQECKSAIAKANTIPFLIDLLRAGQPRNKENAAAILLALCKKDGENLACIGRLGALIPLTELTKSGTDRAKRKATSLLEHLSKENCDVT
ncbi:hypothetical protein LUZ60_000203 [Juncus effusus]|nr:hypothetical protein LUZ60_000203 [Juncus effusus]